MLLAIPPRKGHIRPDGFRSDKEYEAYAEGQERRQRRREDREKWSFDGFPTEEELAQAKEGVERRWICVVEGHDWKRVDAAGDGCEILQCYRCDDVCFIPCEEPTPSHDTRQSKCPTTYRRKE